MSTSIWGDTHDKNMADFEKDIASIQAKYREIFKDQLNRLTGETPDDLNNHFLVKWDIDQYRMWFNDGTYIPEFIRKEVFDSFRLHFSAK